MLPTRTYFLDRLHDDELAALLDGREDFFLENVASMDALVARLQSRLTKHGLNSAVERAPHNPPASLSDLLPPVLALPGLLRSLWQLIAQRIRGGCPDVNLRITSNTSISVRYSRRVHRRRQALSA